MALPEPRPGLVFRYDYLWSHDSVAGSDYGKERPACLVAAMDPTASPRFVVILPITHTRPNKDTVGVEIPARVREALGLDDAPSWVTRFRDSTNELVDPSAVCRKRGACSGRTAAADGDIISQTFD